MNPKIYDKERLNNRPIYEFDCVLNYQFVNTQKKQLFHVLISI